MISKTIMIREKIHRSLRQYCLDNNTTIIDAVTDIITHHLIRNGYLQSSSEKSSHEKL